MTLKSNNWQAWTIIWLALFIGTSLLMWYCSGYIYVITLLSIILLIIYEWVFIRLYLGKKKIGLRSQLEDQMKHYNPTDSDYDHDRILQKISVSATVISILASVTFSLIVFLLGFIYLKEEVEIGWNIDSILIFGTLTSLIIAGLCDLINLDQYDTAADPSFDVKTKWEMRQLALGYFVFGWYFLIFGIFIALSLIHPSLTLIGCCCYVIIHNRFWFQRLGYLFSFSDIAKKKGMQKLLDRLRALDHSDIAEIMEGAKYSEKDKKIRITKNNEWIATLKIKEDLCYLEWQYRELEIGVVKKEDDKLNIYR